MAGTRLISNIAKITAQFRAAAETAVKETAGDIAVTAADLAPYDRGDLSASYLKPSAIEIIDELEVRVGSDVSYSIPVHEGTENQDAQPFFTEAGEANVENFKQRLINAVKRTKG